MAEFNVDAEVYALDKFYRAAFAESGRVREKLLEAAVKSYCSLNATEQLQVAGAIEKHPANRLLDAVINDGHGKPIGLTATTKSMGPRDPEIQKTYGPGPTEFLIIPLFCDKK